MHMKKLIVSVFILLFSLGSAVAQNEEISKEDPFFIISFKQ